MVSKNSWFTNNIYFLYFFKKGFTNNITSHFVEQNTECFVLSFASFVQHYLSRPTMRQFAPFLHQLIWSYKLKRTKGLILYNSLPNFRRKYWICYWDTFSVAHTPGTTNVHNTPPPHSALFKKHNYSKLHS